MTAQEITIQLAEVNDFPRLFEISRIVHTTNYNQLIPESHKEDFFEHYKDTPSKREIFLTSLKEKIARPEYGLLKGVLHSGEIVGYLSYEIHDNKTIEIRSLFVDPSHQGRGVGTKLMEAVINTYPTHSMWLYVIEGNNGAISLYERYGFKTSTPKNEKTFYGAKLSYMVRAS